MSDREQIDAIKDRLRVEDAHQAEQKRLEEIARNELIEEAYLERLSPNDRFLYQLIKDYKTIEKKDDPLTLFQPSNYWGIAIEFSSYKEPRLLSITQPSRDSSYFLVAVKEKKQVCVGEDPGGTKLWSTHEEIINSWHIDPSNLKNFINEKLEEIKGYNSSAKEIAEELKRQEEQKANMPILGKILKFFGASMIATAFINAHNSLPDDIPLSQQATSMVSQVEQLNNTLT